MTSARRRQRRRTKGRAGRIDRGEGKKEFSADFNDLSITISWEKAGFGAGLTLGPETLNLGLGIGIVSVYFDFLEPNNSVLGFAFDFLTIEGKREGCTVTLEYKIGGALFRTETRKIPDCKEDREQDRGKAPPFDPLTPLVPPNLMGSGRPDDDIFMYCVADYYKFDQDKESTIFTNANVVDARLERDYTPGGAYATYRITGTLKNEPWLNSDRVYSNIGTHGRKNLLGLSYQQPFFVDRFYEEMTKGTLNDFDQERLDYGPPSEFPEGATGIGGFPHGDYWVARFGKRGLVRGTRWIVNAILGSRIGIHYSFNSSNSSAYDDREGFNFREAVQSRVVDIKVLEEGSQPGNNRQNRGRKMDDCCEKINKKLNAILKFLGLEVDEDFEIDTAFYTISPGGKEEKLKNLPEIMSRMFLAISHWGTGPVEVDIEDQDLTKAGKQGAINVLYPNAAAALKEVLEEQQKLTPPQQAILTMLSTVLATQAEILAVAMSNNDYSRVTSESIGSDIREEKQKYELPFSVTPMKQKKPIEELLPEILKPSTLTRISQVANNTTTLFEVLESSATANQG